MTRHHQRLLFPLNVFSFQCGLFAQILTSTAYAVDPLIQALSLFTQNRRCRRVLALTRHASSLSPPTSVSNTHSQPGLSSSAHFASTSCVYILVREFSPNKGWSNVVLCPTFSDHPNAVPSLAKDFHSATFHACFSCKDVWLRVLLPVGGCGRRVIRCVGIAVVCIFGRFVGLLVVLGVRSCNLIFSPVWPPQYLPNAFSPST